MDFNFEADAFVAPKHAKSPRSTIAPSSLANFDSFRTPQKRPRFDSHASTSSHNSSGSSVPSLSSFGSSPSSASSTSLLSPLSAAFNFSNDLSPTEVGARSPLDPSLFAAMQETYLKEAAAPIWDPSAMAHLSSAPLSISPTAPLQSTPALASRPVRRSSTHSPRVRPSVARAHRPPPLDLSGLSSPVIPDMRSAPPMAAGVSEPMMQTGSQEDMDRVLWEINALMAQEPPVGDRFKTAPVRPAPCPIQPPTSHVNISGISLEMGDLAMLASRPAHIAPPASAPAFMTNFGAVFPDAYPATAPAFDLVDPFNSIPLPSVYPLAPQATTPLLFPGQSLAYGAEPAWLPNPYLVQRRASASVPLIHRPRSAPIVPSLQASRRASTPSSHKKVAKKTSFVNFSAKDATKLLTAVAPSGSSKRKREEEEAAAADQAAKRRVVSAPF